MEQPLAKAAVVVNYKGANEKSITTDENGEFQLENVASGKYTFDVLDTTGNWEFDQMTVEILSTKAQLKTKSF